MYSSVLVRLTFLCLVFDSVFMFKCAYVPPREEDIVRSVVTGDAGGERRRKRVVNNEYHPMQFDITYHKHFDNIGAELADYVKNDLIKAATTYFSSLLQVNTPTTPTSLKKDSLECGGVEIPEEKRDPSKGVVTDFFLFVTADDPKRNCLTDTSNTTLAYALECQIAEHDRPVAGYINLCPNHLGLAHRLKDEIISTIKHEMLHTMGFSSHKYDKFRHEDNKGGKSFEPTVKETLKWLTRNGMVDHTVTYLQTPSLKRVVQEYFNCSTLLGAELENQGGGGTQLTHFEKRIFENEAMTGISSHNSVFSVMTLALLNDTGWYKVDFTKNETLLWGHKRGCDFVKKSCAEWIYSKIQKNESVAPFCKDARLDKFRPDKTCTFDRLSVATCNFKKFDKPLPQEYQYFNRTILSDVPEEDLKYYGGSVETLDYCPFPKGFDWADKGGIIDRDSKCTVVNNTARGKENAALETTGRSSRCFDHGKEKIWVLKQCNLKIPFVGLGAGCYPHLCKNGSVWFTLLNGTVEKRCLKAGHVIQIRRVEYRSLHIGSVVCPPCEDVCGKEFCTYEYTGSDYSLNILESDLQGRIPCRSSVVSYCKIFVVAVALFVALFVS